MVAERESGWPRGQEGLREGGAPERPAAVLVVTGAEGNLKCSIATVAHGEEDRCHKESALRRALLDNRPVQMAMNGKLITTTVAISL